MSNRLHINAMNYPLPLVRVNSQVIPSKTWGGYALVTSFAPDMDGGQRVVFFGDDEEDLKRRLAEAGPIGKVGDVWVVDPDYFRNDLPREEWEE